VRERIHAPDLTSASAWLNTRAPHSLRDLRGQIVILDFWTYCCINCMHVLPILRDLEERHREAPIVVIGVHSAKFDAEKDDAHILAAMRRYGVAHPVAVDSEMRIWSQYAVRSWPTLVIIRPDGTLAAVAPGEPDPAVLEDFVQQLLAESRAAGTLAKRPARLELAAPEPQRPLRYPGKIAHGGERIFVSDSGHHRVLVLEAKGGVADAIGSGLRGIREGSFESCALSHGADVDSELIVTLRSVACDARDHAACWPVQNSFRIPLRLLAEGQREVRFGLPLELPREERASPATGGGRRAGALEEERASPATGGGRRAGALEEEQALPASPVAKARGPEHK
jgi:thiol-disulfide isomerase/thioredoxin